MATIKSYTDIEQSRKLAEILPLESADMYYPNRIDTKYQGALPVEFKHGNPLISQEIAAWSFAALFGILPEGVIENYYAPNLQKENGKYSIAYGDEELLCIADNPIDACVTMIEKLHKLNLL